MQQKLLTGHVDQRLWNGIILKEGESKQFIELPAAVLPHVEPGQSLRLLFRRQQLVRIFNVSTKEGANKQVISSQADSLIKISRIWADFFPANTS
ncbi:hypothetical protein ACXNAM_16050, partial [Kluyvera cryocrescens]